MKGLNLIWGSMFINLFFFSHLFVFVLFLFLKDSLIIERPSWGWEIEMRNGERGGRKEERKISISLLISPYLGFHQASPKNLDIHPCLHGRWCMGYLLLLFSHITMEVDKEWMNQDSKQHSTMGWLYTSIS